MSDEEIRGSDFRKAWPNALARAQRETREILNEMEANRSAVAKQQDLVIRTAIEISQLAVLAKRKLNAGAEKIDAQMVRLIVQQAAHASLFDDRLKKIETARDDLSRRRLDFADERALFAREVRSFADANVWERIFVSGKLKTITNKYAIETSGGPR